MKRLRVAALAVTMSLVVAACGSSRSDEELARANNGFFVAGRGANAGGTGADGVREDAAAESVGEAGGGGGTSSRGGTERGVGQGGAAPGRAGGAVTAVAPGCKGAGGGKEIVLGTFGTEGGVIGANVVTAPVGIRAWTADVNARGGLCGHPVRVVFGGNDNGDPATAQAIARRLVERDKVVAFITPYSPTAMPPVYDYLEQMRIPVISDASQVQRSEKSPMSFNPASGSAASQLGFIASFATQSKARKVGYLYLREVSSAKANVDASKAYAARYGVQVVYEAAVSLAQPDFTAETSAARSAGADVIVGVVDYTTMGKIIGSANRQGYKPEYAGSLAFVSDAIKGQADLFEGVMANTPTSSYTTPQLAEYRAAVRAYVPRGQLGLLGPVAWSAGKLFERIAPQLDADPTSAEIIEAFYTVKNENLGGVVYPFSFTKGGTGSPYVLQCIQPVRFTQGSWGTPLGAERFECLQ